jgi:hypothetical protein
MSKRLELYSTIAGFIWQAGVRMNDLRNVITFIGTVTAAHAARPTLAFSAIRLIE